MTVILYSCSATLCCKFQHVQSYAGISICKYGNLLQSVLSNCDVQSAQASLFIVQSTLKKRQNVLFLQSSQHEDTRTGQKGAVHLEAGVLGGGRNECDKAMLDMRKNGVLWCLAQAINFVDQNNNGLSGKLPQSPGI